MVATDPLALGPEIDEFRKQFEHMSADADALTAPLSDEQFAWQPAPDVWSVSQCLDHLNATAREYLPALDEGVAEAIRRGLYGAGPYSYNWIGRLMVYLNQPTTRLRASTPKAFRPEPGRSRHDVMAAFPRTRCSTSIACTRPTASTSRRRDGSSPPRDFRADGSVVRTRCADPPRSLSHGRDDVPG